MSSIKTQFCFFTIVDYEKEAQYLEKRHAQGFVQSSLNGFLSPLHIVFIVMLVLYLAIFIVFGVKYSNFKSRLKK